MTHKYRVGEPNMQARHGGFWTDVEIVGLLYKGIPATYEGQTRTPDNDAYVYLVDGLHYAILEGGLRKRPTDTDLSEYSYSELIERLNQVSATA